MITVEEKQEIIDEIVNNLRLSISSEYDWGEHKRAYIKFTLSYFDKNGEEQIISHGETEYLN